MSVIIHDHIISQANMSEAEFRLELGLFLFARGFLSMGKASEFSGVSQYEFQIKMKEKGITISYDEEEFEMDFEKVMQK
jgi:predicted HTH domain antitoxin